MCFVLNLSVGIWGHGRYDWESVRLFLGVFLCTFIARVLGVCYRPGSLQTPQQTPPSKQVLLGVFKDPVA